VVSSIGIRTRGRHSLYCRAMNADDPEHASPERPVGPVTEPAVAAAGARERSPADNIPEGAAILTTSGPLTLERAIRLAAAAFDAAQIAYGHGTDNAIDEASWLLLETLGLSAAIEPDYSRELDRDERERCERALRRRVVDRVPTAYLVGTAWFAGHEFLSDARALVPRSPLAELIVEDFFGLLEDRDAPRVLDLCTGGGCIAVAAALAAEDALVDGSDISAEALSLARENVARHGVGDRVRLLEGSLFEPVTGTYDLILSNPPYVDAADVRDMPAEFGHEPLLGLAAGADGLDLVRRMLFEAAAHLTDGGSLVVEVGNSAEAVGRTWPEVPFAWLEFASGGEGVFLIDRDTLIAHRERFTRTLSA